MTLQAILFMQGHIGVIGMTKRKIEWMIVIIILLISLSVGELGIAKISEEDVNWGIYSPEGGIESMSWSEKSENELVTSTVKDNASIILTHNNSAEEIIIPELQKDDFDQFQSIVEGNSILAWTRKDNKIKKIFIGSLNKGNLSLYKYNAEDLNIISPYRFQKVEEKFIMFYMGRSEKSHQVKIGALIMSNQEMKKIEVNYYIINKDLPFVFLPACFADEEGILLGGSTSPRGTSNENAIFTKIDYEGEIVFSREYFLSPENYQLHSLEIDSIASNENGNFLAGHLFFSYVNDSGGFDSFNSPYLLILDNEGHLKKALCLKYYETAFVGPYAIAIKNNKLLIGASTSNNTAHLYLLDIQEDDSNLDKIIKKGLEIKVNAAQDNSEEFSDTHEIPVSIDFSPQSWLIREHIYRDQIRVGRIFFNLDNELNLNTEGNELMWTRDITEKLQSKSSIITEDIEEENFSFASLAMSLNYLETNLKPTKVEFQTKDLPYAQYIKEIEPIIPLFGIAPFLIEPILSPENLKAYLNLSEKSITLQWEDKNSNTKSYEIYRGATDNPQEMNKIGESEKNSYTDKSIEYNKTYYYSIKTISKEDSKSEYSKVIKVDFVYRTETIIILHPDNPYMTVNGVFQEIDPGRGTIPVIIPEWSRTVVPIRAIIEALGGTISWNGTARKVTINFEETVIELWIDNPKAKVNGIDAWIDEDNHDVKPIIVNSRTMLPLRFVAESLGCDVDWDNDTRTITITYGG